MSINILPHDVIKYMIINHVDEYDMMTIRQVNKAWYNIIVEYKQSLKKTDLNYCVGRGLYISYEYFFLKPSNPNDEFNGISFALLACKKNRIGFVRYFIEKDIIPYCQNWNDWRYVFMQIAIKKSYIGICDLLFDKYGAKCYKGALYQSCNTNDIKIFEYMIHKCAINKVVINWKELHIRRLEYARILRKRKDKNFEYYINNDDLILKYICVFLYFFFVLVALSIHLLIHLSIKIEF